MSFRSLRAAGALSALACALTAGALTACAPTGPGATPDAGPADDCPTLTDDDVNGGATLAAGGCFQVASALTVDDGVLTIEEGATLTFAQDAALRVTGDGRLTARGTEEEPVLFTGGEDQPGFWQGVQFDGSTGADNALEHVIIENAGSRAWNGAAYAVAALWIDADAGAALTQVTIRGSGRYGLLVHGGADWSLADSLITDNAIAAYLHPDEVGSLAAGNTIEDNEEDRIWVSISASDAVATDQTWQAFTAPYRLAERTFVHAVLTLAPGVVVEADQDVSLEVEDEGRLAAVGTADAPITLTAVEKQAGAWQGLRVATLGAANALDHVVIEYGGGVAWTGTPESESMVYLPSGGQLQVTNTTLRGSALYALTVHGDADITGFATNRFEGNARVALVHPDEAGHFTADTVFTDNTEQGVRVSHGSNDAVTTAQTWAALAVPYIVAERTFVHAHLTIAPGAVLAFQQDTSLRVEDLGRLTAVGAVDDRIVFEAAAADAAAGFWQGLWFATDGTLNALTNVDVRQAGGTAWNGAADSKAAIYLDGILVVTDVLVEESGGHGVYLTADAALTCTGATFLTLAETETFSGPGTGSCS